MKGRVGARNSHALKLFMPAYLNFVTIYSTFLTLTKVVAAILCCGCGVTDAIRKALAFLCRVEMA